jgi:hypothetical protein
VVCRYRSGWATPGKDSENKFAPCNSSFIEVDGSQATYLGAGGKSFGCRALKSEGSEARIQSEIQEA